FNHHNRLAWSGGIGFADQDPQDVWRMREVPSARSIADSIPEHRRNRTELGCVAGDQQRPCRGHEFDLLSARIHRRTFQQPHRRGRGHRVVAVGGMYRSTTNVQWRCHNAIDSELLESEHSPGDVDDRIECTDLMKVYAL